MEDFSKFFVGQEIIHELHGNGIVTSLDEARQFIICDFPSANIKGWMCTVKVIKPSDSKQKSARHNQGKIQTREIDPDFILGIGEVLTKSRAKYDSFNWQKDTPFSVPYESLFRHLMAFQKGEEYDNETGCHHLLHAATNLMFLYYHRNNTVMDDRGFKKENK
jgi:hypothetical protein